MCIYDLDCTYTGREGRKQIGTKRDKKSEHSAEGLGPLDPPPPFENQATHWLPTFRWNVNAKLLKRALNKQLGIHLLYFLHF